MIVILYVPEGSPLTNSLKKIKIKKVNKYFNMSMVCKKKKKKNGESNNIKNNRLNKNIFSSYQTRERATEPKHVKRPNGYL